MKNASSVCLSELRRKSKWKPYDMQETHIARNQLTEKCAIVCFWFPSNRADSKATHNHTHIHTFDSVLQSTRKTKWVRCPRIINLHLTETVWAIVQTQPKTNSPGECGDSYLRPSTYITKSEPQTSNIQYKLTVPTPPHIDPANVQARWANHAGFNRKCCMFVGWSTASVTRRRFHSRTKPRRCQFERFAATCFWSPLAPRQPQKSPPPPLPSAN